MHNRSRLLYVVPLALALVPAVLRADDAVAPAAADEVVAPANGARLVSRKATPMVTELLRLVEAERQALVELRLAMTQTTDPSRRLELQRQVETIKRDTERAILRTQIEYARREGRTQVAAELEAALLRLDGAAMPVRATSAP